MNTVAMLSVSSSRQRFFQTCTLIGRDVRTVSVCKSIGVNQQPLLFHLRKHVAVLVADIVSGWLENCIAIIAVVRMYYLRPVAEKQNLGIDKIGDIAVLVWKLHNLCRRLIAAPVG